MVRLNGENMDIAEKTLAQLIAELVPDASRIAVELGGVIIPKSRYAETVLRDGDELEIVTFVGGG